MISNHEEKIYIFPNHLLFQRLLSINEKPLSSRILMLIKISYKKKQKIKIVYQTICQKRDSKHSSILWKSTISETLLQKTFSSLWLGCGGGLGETEFSEIFGGATKPLWKTNISLTLSQKEKSLAPKLTDWRPFKLQNSNGRGGLNFWATPFKFWKSTYLLKLFKWFYYT